MKNYLLILFISASFLNCSTAGPFVTNVSQDVQGNIIIEKCSLEYNAWISTVNSIDCQTYTLKGPK